MITVIITAYKEDKTIGKAIEAFAKQPHDMEILVAAPDEPTIKVINEKAKKYPFVKHVLDPGKGKPVALNICFKLAKGDNIVMSDGDVYVSDNAIEELIKKLNPEKVGAVTGRPVSTNNRNNFMGYISHLLTDVGAHDTRQKYMQQNKFFACSGYLFAMKKLFDTIPENSLADDAVMSHMIHEKGYKISYAPKAKVYVKYPDSLKDWIIQKKRSAGGFNQLTEFFPNHDRMRSFSKEIKEGWYKPFTYPKNLKEYFWTLQLYFLRVYLWYVIYRDINVKKKSFSDIWLRVESTK